VRLYPLSRYHRRGCRCAIRSLNPCARNTCLFCLKGLIYTGEVSRALYPLSRYHRRGRRCIIQYFYCALAHIVLQKTSVNTHENADHCHSMDVGLASGIFENADHLTEMDVGLTLRHLSEINYNWFSGNGQMVVKSN